MNAICEHIEWHHERYGVALFVVPVLLAAFGALSVGLGLASLLQ
jgi:hypothetical protein